MSSLRSCLLLALLTLSTEAHWWWKTTTVTCTVTSTTTLEKCTSKCSSFGRQPCTSFSSSRPHSRSTTTTSATKSPSTKSSKASTRSEKTTSTPKHTSTTSSKRTSTSTTKRSSTSSKLFSDTKTHTISQPNGRSTSTTRTSSQDSRPSTTSQSSSHSSSSTLPSLIPQPPATFFIRAQTSQNEANGQYAVVSMANRLEFTSASPDDAARFTLSSSGNLLYNSRVATVSGATGGVGAVQFLAGAPKEKRQAPAGTPLTCIVTADVNGAALLQCAADASTIQQACGTGFYLGPPPAACQPLVLQQITPGSPSATTNTPTRINPTPGAQFSLQANGPPYSLQDNTNNFGIYTSIADGFTGLTFTRFGSGVPLSLDSDGHLVGVGPTANGQVVSYAATFQIGSTFGPVAFMSGTIDPGYVPIVCRIVCFDAGDGPFGCQMRCQDGANGVNMELQTCGSVLNLGTTVNTAAGCRQPVIAVYYIGS